MTTPEPPPAAPEGIPANLADWGTRAVGLLIDLLPVIILSALTSWNGFLRYIAWLISVGYTAYMGYLDGTTGQTPGKAIMGTRLVNESGNLVGSGAGVGRKFAHIIDSAICLLGWFLPLIDDKRQTIADKLMTTYVVEGAEKKSFSIDLWRPPASS